MLVKNFRKFSVSSLASNTSTTRFNCNSSVFRPKYGLFINGEEISSQSGEYIEVENPATTELITKVPRANIEDVNYAVESAKKAFESGIWSKASPIERSNVLNEAARRIRNRLHEFADIESIQTGRALREMHAQLGRLPEWLEYFSALIRTQEGTIPPFQGQYLNYVKRVPLGVVGQITPWNHPMFIAMKKIAPALATGNSVVIKPSELAPVGVLEMTRLLHEAGLPSGVLNCVTGFGMEAGKALSENTNLKKLDMTGGTETGRIVGASAGKNLASIVSELGGKAPMLVFPDADIEQVVNGCAFASFIATGQVCVMGARLIIHESIYDEVLNKFIQKVNNIRVGDPMDLTTQMGPLISKEQRDKVEHFVQIAREEGAKILTGGKYPSLSSPLNEGYYYEPTVIGNVSPDMTIVQEEVFGPVVVAYSFKDEDDAIRLANNSKYGLAAAIWTNNIKCAHRVAENLDVGITWINDHHRNDPSSPWGGMKDSGIGRENGIEAFNEYTQPKSVVVNYNSSKFDWFVDEKVRYG